MEIVGGICIKRSMIVVADCDTDEAAPAGEDLRPGTAIDASALGKHSSKERDRSFGATDRQVVECRRYLKRCLQKALLRLFRCQQTRFDQDVVGVRRR
jgi:hypothetical protein